MKLNKIKDVLSSVKVKLFLSLSITVLLIILFMILVNNFALEQFYLYKKQITLKTVYESINEYYKKQNRDDDIQTELEKLSIKNNFDILIKDNNGINLYTTNKNFSTLQKPCILDIIRFCDNFSTTTALIFIQTSVQPIIKIKPAI